MRIYAKACTPHMSLPLFRRTPFMPERNDLGVIAGTFAERVFQARGPAVFCKQGVEGFVGEFLKRLHALGSKNPKLLPSLVVKLHALSDHDEQPSLDFSPQPKNRRTAFWFNVLHPGRRCGAAHKDNAGELTCRKARLVHEAMILFC
jgi:hypothetical protein